MARRMEFCVTGRSGFRTRRACPQSRQGQAGGFGKMARKRVCKTRSMGFSRVWARPHVSSTSIADFVKKATRQKMPAQSIAFHESRTVQKFTRKRNGCIKRFSQDFGDVFGLAKGSFDWPAGGRVMQKKLGLRDKSCGSASFACKGTLSKIGQSGRWAGGIYAKKRPFADPLSCARTCLAKKRKRQGAGVKGQ